MDDAQIHFVRFPNPLLQGLMSAPLTGVQFRIALWVIRNTAGWNRRLVSCSWYYMARELGLDRAGVLRAGRQLMAAGVLFVEGGHLGIETDVRLWNTAPPVRRSRRRARAMTAVTGDASHRKAVTADIIGDDASHRNRCQESSLFRRAKDSSKDNLKTYKDRRPTAEKTARQRPPRRPSNSQRRLLAGAARSIPGKYDGLSEN